MPLRTDWNKIKEIVDADPGLSMSWGACWGKEYSVLESLFKDTELERHTSFTLVALEGIPDRWVVYVQCPSTVDPTLFDVCSAHSRFLDVALTSVLDDNGADYPVPDFIKAAFLNALIMLSDLGVTSGQ